MATEYRELNAVIKAIWSVKISPNAEIFNAIKRAIEEEVKNIEPANVQPVVRGKWEPGGRFCPVCGEDKFKNLEADIWADWQPNFCPNCGADMGGKQEYES